MRKDDEEFTSFITLFRTYCFVRRENYSYGLIKTHLYFLGLGNLHLTYLASDPNFVCLFGLSVNLTL
jgi:hypothetical protein